MPVDIAYLRECFAYDPESGVLTWKVRPESHFKNAVASNMCNARYAEIVAGTKHHSGYIVVTLNKR